MSALRDERGMTVIMLAHEEIKTFSDPERDSYDRYCCACTNAPPRWWSSTPTSSAS